TDVANDGATDVANDGATDSAEVIVNERFYNQRLAPAPMEPNGALVRPLQDGTLECHMSCQAPFFVRGAIARALGRPEESVRVIAPAVGGGFGAKGGVYPEQIVVSALAERLGRTVRWVETRSENLVAMTHGRGQVQELRLTGRRDGTLTALVARTVTELGAYCARGVIGLRTSRLMSTGPYRIPRLSLTSLGVLTNTTPTGPYRGAGRPEATAMLERAIDIFAREVGLDAVDVRRRNLLRKEELPTIAPSGASYDSGDYVGALDEVLRLAGYDELRRDQAERRGSGCDRQIGIGVSTFVEVSGVGSEYGAVMIDRDGSVAVLTGSSPHGQGHETTLAQIAADALSVPIGSVRVVHSDTGLVANGTGTFGSRSGQLGGGAVAVASQRLLAQARELAGELLEASARDVVSYDGGRFGVAGVPARTLSLEELAGAAVQKGGLSAEAELTQSDGTYPFGAHLAVVEVERSTGRVELVRLVAVDDCGNVLNPLIVEGQVHGGLAQGVAQALFEGVRYDDMGNPLTSTLADYLVPSAAELPFFETGQTVTPSPRNPLGMKGIGESGTVGAAAAVQNAVLDALAPDGVLHIDMPLTPERVWRAIRGLPAKSCG
ncbi:MAG: xanthine dehydrogenase family protein molybdopterin-binding subunit, partial [Acidimicrobiales bacterium]